jgi:O-acetyl-ADP-ribose deacetylase (regulator of RNase III)
MFTSHSGDLLSADTEAIVNTVNCVGVMGKGIALQFKRAYPANFEAYEKACKKRSMRLGQMFVVPTNQREGPKWIINFPTKGHWREGSNLSDIESGLKDLVSVIAELGITSIALPPLGAGNGGLDWNDVKPLITRELSRLAGLDVQLFEPLKPERLLAPKVASITWGRAILIRLVNRYAQQSLTVEPWAEPSGVTFFEIQKLMYFANVAQPTLKLAFSPGPYGPYSDRVRHLVQDMEGSFLSGYSDGSHVALDLTPIEPTAWGSALADELMKDQYPELDESVISPILNMIHGFENPFGLELLSTAHWVACENPSIPVAELTAKFRSWSERKSMTFSDFQIHTAYSHVLADREMVS